MDKPHKWSIRTIKMLTLLKNKMDSQNRLSYDELAQGQDRKNAAGCFFELLVLCAKDCIELNQAGPFEDIVMTKTLNFYKDYRAN